MIEWLVSFGFKTFFAIVGLTVLFSVGMFILAGIGSLFSGSASYSRAKNVPKIKIKGDWELEWEKIKTKPLTFLKDLGIASLVVLGGVAIFGLFTLFTSH